MVKKKREREREDCLVTVLMSCYHHSRKENKETALLKLLSLEKDKFLLPSQSEVVKGCLLTVSTQE